MKTLIQGGYVVGFDGKGRPMGMQLIGRPRGDLAVLKAGAAYEATLPWPVGAA